MEKTLERTLSGRSAEAPVQFAIFTPNRLGRLYELIRLLAAANVHVLALTVLDATDTGVIRLIVDDPDKAEQLLEQNGFPSTRSAMLVVELDSATALSRLMAALLEGEVNVNYLYAFIPHPMGKSLLALNVEDLEVAAAVLQRHQFRTLRQSDISR